MNRRDISFVIVQFWNSIDKMKGSHQIQDKTSMALYECYKKIIK